MQLQESVSIESILLMTCLQYLTSLYNGCNGSKRNRQNRARDSFDVCDFQDELAFFVLLIFRAEVVVPAERCVAECTVHQLHNVFSSKHPFLGSRPKNHILNILKQNRRSRTTTFLGFQFVFLLKIEFSLKPIPKITRNQVKICRKRSQTFFISALINYVSAKKIIILMENSCVINIS